MLKVGAYLRTQRERKGLSYEQIHEITRISPDVLKKIEEGDTLSAPIFLRGFIKNYAKALGLDPAPLLKELEESEKVSQESVEEEIEELPESPSSVHWDWKKQRYSLVGLCFILLFLLIFLPPFSKVEDISEEKKQTESQEASREISPQMDKKEKEAPAVSLLDTIQQEPFTQEVMIHPSEPLEVFFKADGGSVKTKSLAPEQWYIIKALEKIYMRIDEPVSFSMIYNGEWQEASAPLEQTFE